MKRIMIAVILVAGVATDVQAKMADIKAKAKMTWNDVKAQATQAKQSMQQYVKKHQKELVAAGLAATTVAAVAAGGAVAYSQAQKNKTQAQAALEESRPEWEQDIAAQKQQGSAVAHTRTSQEEIDEVIAALRKAEEYGSSPEQVSPETPPLAEGEQTEELTLLEQIRQGKPLKPGKLTSKPSGVSGAGVGASMQQSSLIERAQKMFSNVPGEEGGDLEEWN